MTIDYPTAFGWHEAPESFGKVHFVASSKELLQKPEKVQWFAGFRAQEIHLGHIEPGFSALQRPFNFLRCPQSFSSDSLHITLNMIVLSSHVAAHVNFRRPLPVKQLSTLSNE